MVEFAKFPDDLAQRIANYKREHPKTNADRIRSMSDEELAELIPNLQDKDLDSLCPPKGSCYKDGGCKACWLEWLRKESEGEE